MSLRCYFRLIVVVFIVWVGCNSIGEILIFVGSVGVKDFTIVVFVVIIVVGVVVIDLVRNLPQFKFMIHHLL